MTRNHRTVSLGDEHEDMLQELEREGTISALYGDSGFSGMVQHAIKDLYENPEARKKEKIREEIQQLQRELATIESREEKTRKSPMDKEEIEQFFRDFWLKVERAQDRETTKQEAFRKRLDGNIRKFRKKFFQVDRRSFREKAIEIGEEQGMNLDELKIPASN